ncbi:MAG: HYR domain-containing protein, partial [Bacteroidota bacterium]
MTAQCSFSCQESITIALSGRSDREITLEEVLVNTEESCPGGDFSVEVLDETGASIGSSVNYQYIGQILTFVVRENNSMNNCTGQLELTDDTPPILNCTDVFVACHADTSPVAIGYPDFSDNIDELVISDLAYEDRVIDLNCLAEHDGVRVNQRIDRDWWVRDSDGNEAHCTQTIFLKRAALNDIEFPPALDDEARPALNCTDDPTDLQQTGYPTIDARPLMGNEICDFSIDFTDRVTEHCEGSSTTHRIWSIIDLCTAEERRHVQVIERNDNIAPAIRCPDTIYATVHPASCQARVELASALVHDDCGTVTTTVSWAFGTSADAGSAVFENIPFGTHELLYTATDDCGNAASCTAIVVVTDDTKPTTLCDDGMEVSLNDTGEVIAPAELFDNGSSDNCAIASYEASRAGGEYVEQLVFTCEDVARSPIPLTFRVTDVSGNYRECAMEVYIVDTDAPAMTCPADMTIGCEVDYRDTGLTGVATGVDACGIEEITHSDVTQLNACGLGTVTRLWRVKDVNGNVSTCEQRIRITSEDELQVVFPADRSIVGCGAAISPDSLGRPS